MFLEKKKKAAGDHFLASFVDSILKVFSSWSVFPPILNLVYCFQRRHACQALWTSKNTFQNHDGVSQGGSRQILCPTLRLEEVAELGSFVKECQRWEGIDYVSQDVVLASRFLTSNVPTKSWMLFVNIYPCWWQSWMKCFASLKLWLTSVMSQQGNC